MTDLPKKARLTDAMAAKFPFLASGQKLVADADQPGLYLKVGKTAKSWVVQTEVRTLDDRMRKVRKTVRRAFASFPEVSVKDARAAAKGELAAILAGEGLSKAPSGVTLGQAWGLYRAHLERTGRSPATIYSYRNAVEADHLLGIWRDTPLADLATAEGAARVAARHDAITAGETHPKHGGSYAANGAMRTLRVIYNFALERGHVRPDPDGWTPTRQVTFNREEARDSAMSRLDLPGWWAAYQGMENRVRAEFQLFLLLSGSRAGAIATARWEHVDVAGRRLHVPTPKGGKARAYDIPLTRPMLACLARARRAGRMYQPALSREWVFPGDPSKSKRGEFAGHMSLFATTEATLPCSGHGLRHTYRNACVWAGVEENLSKKLMNHSQRGDVHSGTYGSREGLWPDLMDAQARISRTIMELARQQEPKARRTAA
ncbi:tyrosine-type recombinase/integrase [Roseinatronobacter sp. NSM]|uniref:tyrosine-type recombinase/integrase n=1 Tax=Roseinatronobacter sp. NSM TaxID=3457785 RepID=UPI00403513B0